MDERPIEPNERLLAEIAALRAEVAALRDDVERAAEAPLVAIDQAFGQRSVLGLRRLGTFLYFLQAPFYAVVRLVRFLFQPRRRYSPWENVYAASFTWVYLKGTEATLLARLRRFVPEFRRIRAELRQA